MSARTRAHELITACRALAQPAQQSPDSEEVEGSHFAEPTFSCDDGEYTGAATIVAHLRCLEPGHPPDCDRRGHALYSFCLSQRTVGLVRFGARGVVSHRRGRCCAPPPEELEGAYELVGEPGKKNGEKRLRHLITRTPEWANVAERERMASLVEPDLARPLRDRSCSALRKVCRQLRPPRMRGVHRQALRTCALWACFIRRGTPATVPSDL